MALKAERLEGQPTPVVTGRRILVKAPLGWPSTDSPPGEDHAEDFPHGEYPQFRGPRRGRIGSRDTLAADVELIAVEGTDEAAVPHPAAGGGAQCGTEVRTERLGHRDATGFVAPGDDSFAHPVLFDELRLLDGLPAGDEIPTLGKRRESFFTHASHRHSCPRLFVIERPTPTDPACRVFELRFERWSAGRAQGSEEAAVRTLIPSVANWIPPNTTS